MHFVFPARISLDNCDRRAALQLGSAALSVTFDQSIDLNLNGNEKLYTQLDNIRQIDNIRQKNNRHISSPPKKIINNISYFWPPAPPQKKSKNRQIYQKKILKNLEKNLEKMQKNRQNITISARQ